MSWVTMKVYGFTVEHPLPFWDPPQSRIIGVYVAWDNCHITFAVRDDGEIVCAVGSGYAHIRHLPADLWDPNRFKPLQPMDEQWRERLQAQQLEQALAREDEVKEPEAGRVLHGSIPPSWSAPAPYSAEAQS